MRTIKHIVLDHTAEFKKCLLNWAQQFDEVAWLDSNADINTANQRYSSFDCLLAADAFTSIKTDYHTAFDKLKAYRKSTNDWIFGYLTYDLKNDIENLSSENYDGLLFPDLFFFQPKKIFLFKGEEVEVHYLNFVADEIEKDIEAIKSAVIDDSVKTTIPKNEIYSRTSKEAYLEKVKRMQHHIQKGDIYEANFCQEFFSENAEIDPLETFKRLNAISKPPFAAFLKFDSNYLLSASPERYIRKEGINVISQPIKGTARRSKDVFEDKKLAETLQFDAKERSENIMITDLVRNDLSRTASKDSVKVQELCGLYSFLQVHQLISTISSQVAPDTDSVEIIRTTFPMGSMTGAPKRSALQIIEELEDTKRGLFSGAVGYFTPSGDFDFSVVIRSILYNKANKYLSFSVGSAITSKSVPEREYEECLLKAKAMREVLS